jgi:hypothetical protein
MKALAMAVAAGAIGFVAAHLLYAPAPPPAPAPARVVVREVPAARIATAVRDEPRVEPTAPTSAPEPPDVVRARDDVAAIVAGAVANHRWTEADRERVRALPLSPRDKLELMRPMIVAANKDELDIATIGPVL